MVISKPGIAPDKDCRPTCSSAKNRNILITNMYGGLGGGEVAILSHIEYLVSKGKNVFLYLLEDGPFREAAVNAGASVIVSPLAWQGSKIRSLLHLFMKIADFHTFLRKENIYLTISYTFNDLVVAGLASALNRRPIIYRAQGDVFKSFSEKPKTWLGPLVMPVIKMISPYIITTTKREHEILEKWGFKKDRLAHVYLGTKQGNDQQSVSSSASLRDKYGWGDSVPVAGVFGRLIQWKGHETVLRAIGRLKRENLKIGLWIIGSAEFGDGDAYVKSLEQIIVQEDIADSVKFLGFREDTEAFMRACDIICHASEFEPFGMVIIEAMMAARPVIASDVSGPRESVINGVTGILVQPGDVVAYTDALRHLVRSPEMRASMGKKAKERASKLFNQERNLARLYEICESHVAGFSR